MHLCVIPIYNATVRKHEHFCVGIFSLFKYIYLGVGFLGSHNHHSRKSKVCLFGLVGFVFSILGWGGGIRLGTRYIDQACTELISIHLPLPPKHHRTHPEKGFVGHLYNLLYQWRIRSSNSSILLPQY